MRTAVRSTAFKRDVDRARKRGKDLEKLRAILIDLIQEKALPRHYLDHPLKGEWKGYRDLHIEPDWLLIYRIVGASFAWHGPALMPISSRNSLGLIA